MRRICGLFVTPEGDTLSVPQAQGAAAPEGCGLCPPKGGHFLRPECAVAPCRGGRPSPPSFASGGREETFQPLFLCAAKKKPLAVKRKRQRGSFDSPPLQSPLKRPRRGLMPPSWIIPGVWFVQSTFQSTKNAITMRIWTDWRGSRNTLRLSRLPYVKYSTGADMATRAFYRAVRKPDSTVARRAFGLQKAERQYAQCNDMPFCA